MKVNLVYVADSSHAFPHGRIVSVRVSRLSDLTLLHSRNIPAAFIGANVGKAAACGITNEIELTANEIEKLFVEGDRTVDPASKKLRTVPDAVRQAAFASAKTELKVIG